MMNKKIGCMEFSWIEELNIWCSIYPVTRGNWDIVMSTSNRLTAGFYSLVTGLLGSNTRVPMVGMTKSAAEDFTREASNKYKEKITLLTDEEWVFCAMGGENFTYSGSDTLEDVGWYERTSCSPKEVGLLKPNKYGLYDMCGNVWEIVDMKEAQTKARGGSFLSNWARCKIDVGERWFLQNLCLKDVGFRVCIRP